MPEGRLQRTRDIYDAEDRFVMVQRPWTLPSYAAIERDLDRIEARPGDFLVFHEGDPIIGWVTRKAGVSDGR